MSVITTADEKLEEAKENINIAYKNILTVLDPDTWGSNEFNAYYLDDLHKVLLKLLEIKRLLKCRK